MTARLRPLFLFATLALSAPAWLLLSGSNVAAATPPSKPTATATQTTISSSSSSSSSTTATSSTTSTTSAGSSGGLVATVTPHRFRSRARAAGDPSDTISDFAFSPATITIHVGDTVTWTNNGPSPHTATASSHSFDTGTLAKGASASHTFTQPGTYAYICTIHPFMHGTVVVLGPSSSGSSSSGSTNAGSSGSGTSSTPSSSSGGSTSGSTTTGSGTGTTNTAATTASGSQLPLTGLDLPATVFVAITLLAGGALVRRFAHH
jgi:plastocyanin